MQVAPSSVAYITKEFLEPAPCASRREQHPSDKKHANKHIESTQALLNKRRAEMIGTASSPTLVGGQEHTRDTTARSDETEWRGRGERELFRALTTGQCDTTPPHHVSERPRAHIRQPSRRRAPLLITASVSAQQQQQASRTHADTQDTGPA